MKNFGKVLIMLGLTVLIIGCSLGEDEFYIDPETLEEGVPITFIIGANALDKITFTPGESSLSGDYVIEIYSLNYATSGAEATNEVTQKTWFQTAGRRGTYEYNSETQILTLITLNVFRLTDSAIIAGTAYKVDYNWLDIVAGNDVAAWAADYVYEEVFTASLTVDNLLGGMSDILQSELDFITIYESLAGEPVYYLDTGRLMGRYSRYVPYTLATEQAVSVLSTVYQGLGNLYVLDPNNENTWIASQNRTYVNGDTISEIFTMVITATSIVYNYSYTLTPSDAGIGGVDDIHYTADITAAVVDFYVAGVETGEMTFVDAWVTGNIVTILTNQTNETIRSWTGAVTPSTLPNVDGATGFGSTMTNNDSELVKPAPGTPDPYVAVTNAVQPVEFVLGNQGDYIYHADFNRAGRSLD